MNSARISPTICVALLIGSLCLASVAGIRAESIMIQEENMKELKCSLPNDRFRLVESNSPGQLFLSDETIDLNLAFKKGDLNGSVPLSLEIQEVSSSRSVAARAQALEYGKDEAVTKNNGLSLHPYGNPIPIAACAGRW